MKVLIHETPKLAAIKRSRVLSCMDHPGGINLSVGQAMGYHPNADHDISVDVNLAVSDGLFFLSTAKFSPWTII